MFIKHISYVALIYIILHKDARILLLRPLTPIVNPKILILVVIMSYLGSTGWHRLQWFPSHFFTTKYCFLNLGKD